MKGVIVGCGQITWGRQAPEEQVLAEIAAAGYEGAPASPRGGRSAAEAAALYARHGLKPGPGYLGAAFWAPEQRETILEQARMLAAFHREVGCTECFVAAHGFDHVAPSGKTRAQVSGQVRLEDALPDAAFDQMARVLNEVGETMLKEGVRACYHNHVGTVVETREEIDKLFARVDRSLVFQGPDIGHLAWAGADPVQFARDYAESIKAVHMKDINPKVVEEGCAKQWDYRQFSDAGVFAEFGEGMVNFPALFEVLGGAGYQGWLIVETDVTQLATAAESAQRSRRYLRSLGL